MPEQTITARVERITRVWALKAKLYVPHEGNEIAFASPSFSPGTYKDVMKEILDANLKIPTGEYTASLLHASYCGPEEFRKSGPVESVRNTMKEDLIWAANKNLWIPNREINAGVFVVYDKKGIGLNQQLNQGELEKALEDGEELTINGTKIRVSNDRKVRFAPRDSYDLGVHSPEDLAKNGFVIASYLTQANQLAEVSRTFDDNQPTVWIVEPVAPEQRVSALDVDDDGLHVSGSFEVDDRGHAFGVL